MGLYPVLLLFQEPFKTQILIYLRPMNSKRRALIVGSLLFACMQQSRITSKRLTSFTTISSTYPYSRIGQPYFRDVWHTCFHFTFDAAKVVFFFDICKFLHHFWKFWAERGARSFVLKVRSSGDDPVMVLFYYSLYPHQNNTKGSRSCP